jgi:hypothetical protein
VISAEGKHYPTILFTTTTSRGFLPLDFGFTRLISDAAMLYIEGGKWWPRCCNIAVEKGHSRVFLFWWKPKWPQIGHASVTHGRINAKVHWYRRFCLDAAEFNKMTPSTWARVSRLCWLMFSRVRVQPVSLINCRFSSIPDRTRLVPFVILIGPPCHF